jgi:stage II sporulation protein D
VGPTLRTTVAIAIGGVLALPATAGAIPVATITGHGHGHGVGMSQWGAEGMARGGARYGAILDHYYPGTTRARQPAARIRVLLVDRATAALDVGAVGAATVDDGDPLPVRGTLRAVPARGGLVAIHDATGATVGTGARVVLRSDAPIALGTAAYRGDLVLVRAGAAIRVIDDLPIDDYVRGVIAWEMPSSWHAAALRAQAIAARSYALAERSAARAYDVLPDTRSQMYGGVRAETPATDAATSATAGVALMWNGAVARAFFHDSSGGRTADVADIWSGGPVPYLVSVSDPADAIAPDNTWAPARLTGAALGRRLGTGPVDAVAISHNGSGRVAELTVMAAGSSTTIAAGVVRTRLGLRSTWFAIRILDLLAARPTATRVRIAGTVSPPAPVRIEGLVGTGWVQLARVAAADGTVAWRGRHRGATRFRLRVGTALSTTRDDYGTTTAARRR